MNVTKSINIPLPSYSVKFLDDDGTVLKTQTAVSYTHLDVYKRQHRCFYKQMDMLEDYLLVDVTCLSLQHEAVEYKTAVAKVIDLLMNEHPQKGLYLWGKPGAGKSWLAAGMCNYYAKQEKRVAFVNVPKLISDLKLLFHEPDAMEARLRSIRNAEVVVFDDIGGESVTAWSRDDILLPLMDARMEKRRLTIFTLSLIHI